MFSFVDKAKSYYLYFLIITSVTVFLVDLHSGSNEENNSPRRLIGKSTTNYVMKGTVQYFEELVVATYPLYNKENSGKIKSRIVCFDTIVEMVVT